MNDSTPSTESAELEAGAETNDTRVARLETRLARLEGQIRGLQDRMAEMGQGERSTKQRALVFRLVLLAVLLALFFLVQMRRSGAG